jgi:hypothetical protein
MSPYSPTSSTARPKRPRRWRVASTATSAPFYATTAARSSHTIGRQRNGSSPSTNCRWSAPPNSSSTSPEPDIDSEQSVAEIEATSLYEGPQCRPRTGSGHKADGWTAETRPSHPHVLYDDPNQSQISTHAQRRDRSLCFDPFALFRWFVLFDSFKNWGRPRDLNP